MYLMYSGATTITTSAGCGDRSLVSLKHCSLLVRLKHCSLYKAVPMFVGVAGLPRSRSLRETHQAINYGPNYQPGRLQPVEGSAEVCGGCGLTSVPKFAGNTPSDGSLWNSMHRSHKDCWLLDTINQGLKYQICKLSQKHCRGS